MCGAFNAAIHSCYSDKHKAFGEFQLHAFVLNT